MLFDFFVSYYSLIVMLIAMFILTVHDVYLNKAMLVKLRCAIITIFAVTVFSSIEEYFAQQPTLSIWRFVLSAICYSLRPVIIMLLIFIVYSKVSKLITIPALINMFFAFSCFFTDIVFTFTPENDFKRGVLGYEPYFVNALYLFVLMFVSIRNVSNNSIDESIVLLFITFASMGSAVFSYFGYQSSNIVDNTSASMILIYYLYSYSQCTKKDTLTKLYNRQSYYSDINKKDDGVSGVISIDMNELKWINDTMGHEAGDKGIIAVSECLLKYATINDKVYRIGGDEFLVICHRKTENEIKDMIDKMRKAVIEKGYSCAFGFAVDKKVDELIKEADSQMYDDKARIKAEMKAHNITLHPRD